MKNELIKKAVKMRWFGVGKTRSSLWLFAKGPSQLEMLEDFAEGAPGFFPNSNRFGVFSHTVDGWNPAPPGMYKTQ